MAKDVFDLEYQYKLYLSKVDLKEGDMHETQKVETKRAFMGGVGQALVLLGEDLTELTEEEAIKTLGDMLKQINSFFKKDIEEFEKKSKLTIVR